MGLPGLIETRLDRMSQSFLNAGDVPAVDFTKPFGEPALTAPDSVSWQIFRNPVTVAIGGIAAVILELSEPRVRSGVWDHSGFRQDPARRLRRTGMAAMVTVYGARSVAERMIAGVSGMHARVQGQTPAGETYHAMSPELLTWVHATASFGFLEAFNRYVAPVSKPGRDRFYNEGRASALLYGATGAPQSESGRIALFCDMMPKLECSPIIFEFLEIMRSAPILPWPLRRLQLAIVSAAIDLVPDPVRAIAGLKSDLGLSRVGRSAIRTAARAAHRVVLPSSAAAQACTRLGLPRDYLLNPIKARSFT